MVKTTNLNWFAGFFPSTAGWRRISSSMELILAIEVVQPLLSPQRGNASAPLNGTAAPKKIRFEACPAQTTVQASQYNAVR